MVVQGGTGPTVAQAQAPAQFLEGGVAARAAGIRQH
jgi:hypothetical protein